MDEKFEKGDLRPIAEGFLSSLAVPLDDTNVEQFMFLLRAFQIFLKRNAVRRDLWKEYGAEDTITHMRSKYARVKSLFYTYCAITEPDLETQASAEAKMQTELFDDLFDLINYAIFFGRNVEDGRLGEQL